MVQSLVKRIRSLETHSRKLEPDNLERNQWLSAIVKYTDAFFAELPERPAVQSLHCESDSELAISGDVLTFDQALALFHENVINTGTDTASSRYMAYIPGGGVYPAALGDYLAALTNRYAGISSVAPGAVKIEKELIRWMSDIMGYDASSSGNLTSGGSMANLIALVTARETHAIQAKNIDKTVVYLTANTHNSVSKCLRVIGLREAITRYIPVDACCRMDADALKETIEKDIQDGLHPWLIVASAGTTDAGSVDPISHVSDIAKQHQLWLHVDAAYGGFFMLTEHGKKLFEKINQADSITLDPHKGLFLPYGIGAVLIKDAVGYKQAFASNAAYLQDTLVSCDVFSPSDLSSELTKHFRALRMWLPLKLTGVEPFRAALEEKLLLANYFYEHK